MADDPKTPPCGRRSVFRLGLQRLIEPLAAYVTDRLDVQLPIVRSVLRPPGALPEAAFLKTCYRCGNCVDVCPAKAIRTITAAEPDCTGTPYIDPDLAACVFCDELACIKACPSGALKTTPSPGHIRLGTASWKEEACLRSTGETCTACADRCPIGPSAISLNQRGRIEIRAGACVGCGTCQFYCPASPKAIQTEP
ncbi:MAG: 4Fe-4S dicluster domain-containing protein [Phycisphaerae bacterium]|nr:4Fe-4S dicluster domain-containing protein [Phycisphaerae bacterium]